MIASAKDHTKAIVDAAVDPHHPSEYPQATVETLVSILASEASNLALKVLATGGLYLAGGVALHLLDAFERSALYGNFRQKRTIQRSGGPHPRSHHHRPQRGAGGGRYLSGLESLKSLNRQSGMDKDSTSRGKQPKGVSGNGSKSPTAGKETRR